MPDAADILHQRAQRHIDAHEGPLAGEDELATPAPSPEIDLAGEKTPTIIEYHAIFYGDPRLPETKGRLFRDESDAWSYGKVLSIRPRKVTVILEGE